MILKTARNSTACRVMTKFEQKIFEFIKKHERAAALGTAASTGFFCVWFLSFLASWVSPERLFLGAIFLVFAVLFTGFCRSVHVLVNDPSSQAEARLMHAKTQLLRVVLVAASLAVAWIILLFPLRTTYVEFWAAIARLLPGADLDTRLATLSAVDPECKLNGRFAHAHASDRARLVRFADDMVSGAAPILDWRSLVAASDCQKIIVDGVVDLTLEPDSHDIVLAAREVHFKENAAVRIGSRKLVIIAGAMTVEKDARVEAFAPGMVSALPTAAKGGDLTVVLASAPKGSKLFVDLRGQNGREGQAGQTPEQRPSIYPSKYEDPVAVYKARLEDPDEWRKFLHNFDEGCKAFANSIAPGSYNPPPFIHIGKIIDSHVETFLRLSACIEIGKEPIPNSTRAEGEAWQRAGSKMPYSMCIRPVRHGRGGDSGALAEPGERGRDGGAGGKFSAEFPTALTHLQTFIDLETVTSLGGNGGKSGAPQRGSRGEPAVEIPKGFEICGPSNAGLEGLQDQKPCKVDEDCHAKSGCRGAQMRVQLRGKAEFAVGNKTDCNLRQSVQAPNR